MNCPLYENLAYSIKYYPSKINFYMKHALYIVQQQNAKATW
jgi:hypothetical protein